MAHITVKGISFPVEKIEIIRKVQYAKPEEDTIYLPEDVKLYQIPDTDIVEKYDGKDYVFHDYIGISNWTKEKEQISHSMQIVCDGESTNYPVVNSLCFTAYNLFDKILIYYVKGISAKNDEIPTISYIPYNIHNEIYFKKTIEDEDVMNEIIDYINNSPKGKCSPDKIAGMCEKLERPYAYYKVHGIIVEGDEALLDVTIIQTDSEYKCVNGAKSIIRTGIPFAEIEESSLSDLVRKVKEINYLEYSKVYNDIIKLMI